MDAYVSTIAVDQTYAPGYNIRVNCDLNTVIYNTLTILMSSSGHRYNFNRMGLELNMMVLET